MLSMKGIKIGLNEWHGGNKAHNVLFTNIIYAAKAADGGCYEYCYMAGQSRFIAGKED